MVSGRFAVAIRQFLVIGVMFGTATYFISWQQGRVYDQATQALNRISILQQDHVDLMEKGSKIMADSNRTMQLLQFHLKHMDTIEQSTKRKNLILRGVKEFDSEDIDKTIVETIKNKMNIELSSDDIEYAQRIIGTNGEDIRPILIRFVHLKDKSKVFYKRKSLPKYLTLEEDLTESQKENRKKLNDNGKKTLQDGKAIAWNEGNRL